MAQEGPREGQVGTAPDGTRVVFRNGQAVPIGGPEFPGFTPQGMGLYTDQSGTTFQINRQGQLIRRGGGGALVGADARGRYNIGADALAASARAAAAEEARGGNPMNRDWGAVVAAGIDLDPREGNSFRPLAPFARWIGGQDYQNYDQALATYEASLLPIQSGAAVTDSEARRQIRADFPQLGDSEETVRRKAQNRLRRINAVFAGIGRPAPFTEAQIADPTSVAMDDEMGAINAAGGAGGSAPTPTAPGTPSGPVDISGMSAADLLALTPGTEIRYPDGTVATLGGAPFVGARGREVAPGLFVDEQTPEEVIEERRDMNPILRRVDGLVRGAADGITFGLADEVAAGANSLLPLDPGARAAWQTGSFGEAYRHNVALQRRIDRADVEDIPITRGTGQIAGGLAGVGGVARTGAGATRSLLQQSFRGAGAGAAYGGAYGIGSGEGNVFERAPNGLRGAAVGAVTGGAAPSAINVGSRVATPVVNALLDGAQAAARPIASILPAPVQNALAVNPLARGLERFAGTNRPNVNELLANRAELEGALGREVAAADVINTGGRGLLRGTSMTSDRARQTAENFAEGRVEELPNRLSQQGRRIVSGDNRSVADITDGLRQRRGALAREEYAAPYAEQVAVSDDILAALQGGPGRTAIRNARSAAEAWQDAAAVAELDALEQSLVQGGPPPAVSAGVLDSIRQSLTGRGERLSQNPATRAAGGGITRRAGQVDEALEGVEGLGPARATYRELSSQIKGAELGGRFLNSNPDEVIAFASNASPEALGAARAGMARNIEIASGTTSGAPSVARRLGINNTPTRQVLNATLGEADASRLAAAANAERRLASNAARVSPGVGSPTAPNQSDMARAGLDLIGGRPLGMFSRLIDQLDRRGFNAEQAEAVLEAMTDPARTDEVISILSQRMNRREARNLTRALRQQITRSLQSGQQE